MKEHLTMESLMIDPAVEAKRIEEWVRETVHGRFRKKGVVIGLSGGVDSSVCAAICVNALGKEKILGLFTPEKECEEETNSLGRMIADHLEVKTIKEDITPILDGADSYGRRNEGIRKTIPEFQDTWRSKVVLPDILESNRFNISSIVVQDEGGNKKTKRMNLSSYLQVVAASNFKQRIRKMVEYYHAERTNYCVIGTPNKLEYDLGFFVKYGDGAADLKPIAHLYKSQVYQLGDFYNIPEEILKRPPTTDTYSLPQSQEEFFFSLRYDLMDLSLFSYDNGYSEEELSRSIGVTTEQAERIYRDIESKKKVAGFLHLPPVIME